MTEKAENLPTCGDGDSCPDARYHTLQEGEQREAERRRSAGLGLLPDGTCPKCHKSSGDDWSQCGGSCPVKDSPHYSARWAEEQAERAAQAVLLAAAEACRKKGGYISLNDGYDVLAANGGKVTSQAELATGRSNDQVELELASYRFIAFRYDRLMTSAEYDQAQAEQRDKVRSTPRARQADLVGVMLALLDVEKGRGSSLPLDDTLMQVAAVADGVQALPGGPPTTVELRLAAQQAKADWLRAHGGVW